MNRIFSRFRSLVVAPFILLPLWGWHRLFPLLRDAVIHDGTDPRSLQSWWLVNLGLYFIVFAITVAIVLLFFRLLKRAPSRFLTVVCILNTFIVWAFFGLAAVTSDPVVVDALSPAGLASLHTWLWSVAVLWWVPLLYIVFKTVDLSPTRTTT